MTDNHKGRKNRRVCLDMCPCSDTHCLTDSYVLDPLTHTAPAAISATSPTTTSTRRVRTSAEEEEVEEEV